jgi:RNA-directed DNA polymerase
MHGRGKSDGLKVPAKLPNKGDVASPAEAVEGSGPAKGNLAEQNKVRTQRRAALQNELGRVREAAKRDKKQQFTALWHHVYSVDRLREAYFGLKRKAAAGIDGETWETYQQNLETNIVDLSARLKNGAYQAKPVRRVYIPKADGRQRPIGVTTLEDKIVQRATSEVLESIYETDFLGFSYGFRRGRGQHNALDAVAVGIRQKRVRWILDADIRGFFDAISHEWLMKFIEHRIGDKRVHRHVLKWLNAGVIESDELTKMKEGTPQGGSVSPLLANIYLHYAFDLWAEQWRRRHARSEMMIVRYADDAVVGFNNKDDADDFLVALRERLLKFNLELNEEKTRVIEFGLYARDNRRVRGQGKPETFNFLGFTHVCGYTSKGRFMVVRQTMRDRMQRKLASVKLELRRHINAPIWKIGKWLGRVLQGHYNYYGVPMNGPNLKSFRRRITHLWHKSLERRSQKARMPWTEMRRIADKWLPQPRIVHPHPRDRLCV